MYSAKDAADDEREVMSRNYDHSLWWIIPYILIMICAIIYTVASIITVGF